MTWKTHMIGGVFAGAATIYAYDTVIRPVNEINSIGFGVFMLSAAVTALLPDTDEKNSKAGKMLFAIPFTLAVIKSIIFMLEIFTFGIVRKKLNEKRKAMNHRGILHWLITWGILSIVVMTLGTISYISLQNSQYQDIAPLMLSCMVGFMPGYISHIMLDLISGRIQVLAPFNKKLYGKQMIRVGSLPEVFLVRPVLAIASVCLINLVIK